MTKIILVLFLGFHGWSAFAASDDCSAALKELMDASQLVGQLEDSASDLQTEYLLARQAMILTERGYEAVRVETELKLRQDLDKAEGERRSALGRQLSALEKAESNCK